jgi:hypothetical protein
LQNKGLCRFLTVGKRWGMASGAMPVLGFGQKQGLSACLPGNHATAYFRPSTGRRAWVSTGAGSGDDGTGGRKSGRQGTGTGVKPGEGTEGAVTSVERTGPAVENFGRREKMRECRWNPLWAFDLCCQTESCSWGGVSSFYEENISRFLPGRGLQGKEKVRTRKVGGR